MALFDFLQPLLNRLKTFLGPLGKIWDKVGGIIDHLRNLIPDIEHLRDTVLDEISAWKNFKEDIRFRQRVVNLETAVKKTRDLIQGAVDSWHSIVDVVKQIRKQVPTETATVTAEDLEAGAEEGTISGILERFPRLARAAERLLGVLTVIFDALESISQVVQDLQQIVDELKRIRLEIEKLDTIFLSQGNKRKTLKLADGSSIRVRVGKLHESLV